MSRRHRSAGTAAQEPPHSIAKTTLR